jgi:hypothetical protein
VLVPATPVTLNLGINMNIELDEVVVQHVSDDALELAAGGAQEASDKFYTFPGSVFCGVGDYDL